jgi:hypothetical protein
MARAIYVICGLLVLIIASCTERMICPAYQSAYIYDKNELRKKFSYFQEDSTPKIFTASKTKYLIAEPTPYRKKLRSLQSVPMKQVPVVVPDSISGVKQDSSINDDLNKAALSVMDTTMIVDVPPQDSVVSDEDSTYVITKDKEVKVLKYNMPDSLEYDSVNNKYVAQKPAYYIEEVGFNTEQDNYMWYLRRSLVLPDVKLAKLQSAGKEGKKKAEEKAQKGIRGFFSKLFGKKKTDDVDSAELNVNKDEEEFDFIDTTAVVPDPALKEGGRRSKKENEISPEAEEVTPEQQPEEEKPRNKRRRREEENAPSETPTEEPKKENGDGF